jgi:NADPH-dependent 2,4-dienoyl-CoA reductase/sulfur reductase-like enzyme
LNACQAPESYFEMPPGWRHFRLAAKINRHLSSSSLFPLQCLWRVALMVSERLIVVGGVAAGLSAASQARRVNPQLEIIVYEKGPDISYSACGIPYFLAGAVAAPQDLLVYPVEFFRDRRRIQVLTHHDVHELSISRRRLTVISPGGPFEIHYDRLVLATGAEPASPQIAGIGLAGVFHVNDLQSAVALHRFLQSKRPHQAAIIGGGYIGLEMAEALSKQGVSVTLVEHSSTLFESVDEEISTSVDQELSTHGVKAIRGARVTALLGGSSGRVERVVWEGGEGSGTAANLVVLATGVRPRTQLAEDAGIQLGPTGAIQVNEYMETSAAAVYAAGDCAESLHRVSGRPVYVPLGTTANKQGRVAGQNAAGLRARFRGIVGTAALKVFSLEVARTGLSMAEARAAGFRPRQAVVRAPNRARYLGGKDLLVKLVADPASGRLLGAQMAGLEGVAKRIDVFAAALQARMTVEEVSQLDLSYAPPFAPVWDPVLIAAQQMLHELKR